MAKDFWETLHKFNMGDHLTTEELEIFVTTGEALARNWAHNREPIQELAAFGLRVKLVAARSYLSARAERTP